MSSVLFNDRYEAGEVLARFLGSRMSEDPVLVLALPRGGLPVAFPIAKALSAPLDVFLVRKLGVPGHEELAMGAVASGGIRVLNEDVVEHLGISERVIEAVAREELAELQRREHCYRGERPDPEVIGKRVILVDDGLATGASMHAAVRALRLRQPRAITVAVPVGAADTCDRIRREVDDLVCGATPEPFQSVGGWYQHFGQVSDDEVCTLLEQAAQWQTRPVTPTD